MKLYVGGAFQGQEELARQENPGAEIVTDFHEEIRRVMETGGDVQVFVSAFLEAHPGAVVVANELGSGIVPMEKGDRLFREAAGRALCCVAQRAETVVRVVCGLGVKIK